MQKFTTKIFFYLFVLLLTSPALFASQQGTQTPIKVLVIDGFSNHDWQATTNFIRQTLEDTNLFKVDVSTCPDTPDSNDWQSWHPDFKNYDCIIQNTNNIKNKNLRWPHSVEIELENYVKSGGGLYIFHSANNAFDHWKEYDKMIGLGWRSKDQGTAIEISPSGDIIRIPKGQGKDTYHGPRSDVTINILNSHPINADFPKAWKTPDLEVYKFPRGPAENLTVLSYAYDPGTQKNWPIDWIVSYGKGRVYNSTFGHIFKNQKDPASIHCIGFQTTFIRAVQWLATQKVTYPLPANFPSADKISLK